MHSETIKKCIFVFLLSARYSCQIVMTLEYLRHIFVTILKYQIRLKSVQWKPRCYMRADGQKDTMKLVVAFRNFAQRALKNCCLRNVWEEVVVERLLSSIHGSNFSFTVKEPGAN